MDDDTADDRKNPWSGGSHWLAIGLALGVAFGVTLDNIALGIAIGVAIGAGMMGGTSQAKKRPGDDDLRP